MCNVITHKKTFSQNPIPKKVGIWVWVLGIIRVSYPIPTKKVGTDVCFSWLSIKINKNIIRSLRVPY